MKVFELKDAIVNLLEENSGGRYVVLSPQNRKGDAENIFQKPRVTVFYASGDFDRTKSSVNSPYHHDAAFNIHIQVAAKSTVNLAVLQNPLAAAEQYAAALDASGSASVAVDEKADELLSLLYDIIMSPVNRNLGTDYITNRWITRIKKYNPELDGAIVTMIASITLAAECEEEVSGAIPAPAGSGAIDTVVELGDPADESKQGVKAGGVLENNS